MPEQLKPMDIEARSFEIITELLGDRKLDPENALVIKRAIHTTADFDYADNLVFSPHAVQKGIEALKAGCDIVTDTQMARAGINKTVLESLGGAVHCFMSDADVAQEAKRRGVTRAFVSMEKAAKLQKPCIFAIGNAPTALFCLENLMQEGALLPALIIGVPVGFVNVVESKEQLIASSPAPYHRRARAERAAATSPRQSATRCSIRSGDKWKNTSSKTASVCVSAIRPAPARQLRQRQPASCF